MHDSNLITQLSDKLLVVCELEYGMSGSEGKLAAMAPPLSFSHKQRERERDTCTQTD